MAWPMLAALRKVGKVDKEQKTRTVVKVNFHVANKKLASMDSPQVSSASICSTSRVVL